MNPKNKKALMIVVGIVIVGLIGYAGYYLGTTQKKVNQNAENVIVTNQEATNEANINADELTPTATETIAVASVTPTHKLINPGNLHIILTLTPTPTQRIIQINPNLKFTIAPSVTPTPTLIKLQVNPKFELIQP
jgi:hypothetical protein